MRHDLPIRIVQQFACSYAAHAHHKHPRSVHYDSNLVLVLLCLQSQEMSTPMEHQHTAIEAKEDELITESVNDESGQGYGIEF